MNLPNKLTLLRICMIPLFIIAYFLPFTWSSWLAVGIFVLAAFTDFLDGHIARKYNLVTDFGKLLDPVADKILVTSALFCLVATNPLQWMQLFYDFPILNNNMFGIVFLTSGSCIILARELLVDGVRMVAASKGTVVQANKFGKIKTVLQDISLPILICLNTGKSASNGTLYMVFYVVGVALFFAAVVMTIISGVIYLVQNKFVFEDR